ncbi:MAG: 4-hydroxy-3-methylbut-2-enyl diphosphate reductase [Candidatus Moranbacteria bacterium]|nr:4-hydroxy-3-methylbut-2-enyl diphosphate reductase [Candidatus Moranbacteria bacterium]
MKIITSRKSGFCSGVRRAYEKVKKNYSKYPKPIYILGDLVHNTYVINETRNWGIKKIFSPEEAKKGTVIITAHGIDPKIIQSIRDRGVEILNVVCPKVSRVIAKARFLKHQGRQVLIFGNKDHSEVKAINGAIENQGVIFSDIEDLREKIKKISRKEKLGLVCQTTRNIDEFKQIKQELLDNFPNIKVINTICSATYKRQKEAKEKAREADVVIVIGSPFSANSKELYKICKKLNQKTYFVDKPIDLKKQWFKKDCRVWICTGASIPDYLIKQFEEKLKSYDL